MKDQEMKNNNRLIDYSWIIVCGVVYILLFLRAMSFQYIEGDDASSIAYHLLGRNQEFQPPYDPIQGMMDITLKWLPAEEVLLRHVSMGITYIAGVILFVLILILIFEWLGDVEGKPKLTITAALMLASPEVFFWSLVYSPTLVAMCLVLVSHILLRRVPVEDLWSGGKASSFLRTVFTLLLFGLGVSFRWNVLLYGIVIFVDLLLFDGAKNRTLKNQIQKRVGVCSILAILAVAFSLIAINLSGYGIGAILGEFDAAMRVSQQVGTSYINTSIDYKEILLRYGITISTLITPGLGLIAAYGIWLLIRRGNLLWVLVLMSFLSVIPWLKSGVPKFVVTAIPGLFLAFVAGITSILESWKGKYKGVLSFGLILVLVGPWLIGAQVTRESAAWGPGFELRPYDYEHIEGTVINVGFSPGAAFPTPEGPRPLAGYIYVLFGGKWKEFVDGRAAERENVIDSALRGNQPIVITSWSPSYFVVSLYRRGFQTDHSSGHLSQSNPDFVEREFYNDQNQKVTLMFFELEGGTVFENIPSLLELSKKSGKIILVGYPSVMRALYEGCSDSMLKIGSTSTVINLDEYSLELCRDD
jgi:hypothetical protein